jgi:hypothetical protein
VESAGAGLSACADCGSCIERDDGGHMLYKGDTLDGAWDEG